jgi:predicted ATP-dependent endonuclease of OLD family
MKIEKVEIKNFRSILNGSFYIDSILAIIGQNNAGKSNIIAALDSFFHPDNQIECYLNGKNSCGLPRRIPSITIYFSDVTCPELSQYINDNIVIIKQDFKNKKLSHQIYNPSSYKYEQLTIDITKYIDLVLIPVNRLPEIETDTLTRGSIVYKAIETSLRKLSEKRDTFSVQLRRAYDYIDKHAFGKIAKEINKYYMATDVQAIIKKAVDIDSTILMQILGININEKGKEFPINYCGSGIQSLFVIGVYQYLSEQLGINYVIVIEEPEVNLHPQAQRQFINNIAKTKGERNNQVVISTHSPYIVDLLGHTKLLLVRKANHPQRGFYSTITQLRKDFFNEYRLCEPKYYEFAGFKNSDVFFSSYVIITESPIDGEVVKLLAEKTEVDLSNTSVSILSLGGVNNTKYVYALLRELDIPHSWVFDKDFFLDYKNNNIKDRSRNRYGFFQYTVSLTTNENKKKLIELLIPNKPDRDRIITLLHNNHTKASELLNKYNIICMRYNLEMDMCSSIASQMFLYNKLGIPANKQSINTLLTEYKEKIKDAIIVHETISQLSKKNLPTSFQTIIRLIKTIA